MIIDPSCLLHRGKSNHRPELSTAPWEVQPIKFVVPKALLTLIEEARLRNYEQSKKHYVGGQQFRPDTWDMGEEANAVLPRTEPEVIEG